MASMFNLHPSPARNSPRTRCCLSVGGRLKETPIFIRVKQLVCQALALAAQVAHAMEVYAISYRLSKRKEILCSTCSLFIDKEYFFIPIDHLVKSGGMRSVFTLFNFVGATVGMTKQLLDRYRSTLQLSVYDDFIGIV